jgi:steroid 5-alpha reductase family enzyme
MNPWILVLLAWLVMAVVMHLAWLLACRRGDASIVDLLWSIGVGCLGVTFALTGDGPIERRVLIAAMAAFWSARLSMHLATRFRRMPKDGRYAHFESTLGERAKLYLAIFFQIQAAWTVLFALPMFGSGRRDDPELGSREILAISIVIVSLAGEAFADRQLSRFRENPANRGSVCRVGLWSWSRHPNYFFEWMHWWGYVALGFDVDADGLLTLVGPIAMFILLRYVTGVPTAEAQCLRSRGDAYRAYQRTTSAFFPWPPRSV